MHPCSHFFIIPYSFFLQITASHCVAAAPRCERDILNLCRAGKWAQVETYIRARPWIATTPMLMGNNIKTTIMHQAIGSKGDTQGRVNAITTILELAPVAASIPNGTKTLPLHAILQRNVKMDTKTRETLILELIKAYPDSLLRLGGLAGRTPLHIAFTDFLSAIVIRTMIRVAPSACFVRDRKGWLPIHIACHRNCSKEKLRMLLDVNPAFLHATTTDGESLLQLATSAATKSHPNKLLISELQARLESWKGKKEYSALQGEAMDSKKNSLSTLAIHAGPQVLTPSTKSAAKLLVDMVPDLVSEFAHAEPPTVESCDRAAANVLCRFRQARSEDEAMKFVGELVVVESAEV